MSLEFDLATHAPSEAAQPVLFLPAWTPGSYLIREFARHLSRVTAVDVATGAEIRCRKIAKNRFQIDAPEGTRRVRVGYRVYAHELTVRTADATADHAFWNHACLLLWPLAAMEREVVLRIDHPSEWQLACSLAQRPDRDVTQRATVQTTTLLAKGIDEVMDAPCLVGRFDRLDWSVDGIPHAIVLDGLAGVSAPAKLVEDLTSIVTAAKSVFGGTLPYPHYTFLCLFAADGHGGLEHATSTTLLASRTEWTTAKGYREFLGLAAHELFHAWNVKRMRPSEFWRYDYEQENYTELLWLIEGWTAYYDDLLCQRAGLLTRDEYLAILGKSITTAMAGPGRHRLSLRESSFDAWIRLYRPDENTRNSSQNYYGNGSIAAVCLDLTIRRVSNGERTLDHVIRELYERTFGKGRGYTTDDVHAILEDIGGAPLVATLHSLVSGPLDPDLRAIFASFGIRLVVRDSDRAHLGITFEAGGTRIASVARDSAAHVAGLAPGDEVIAVQGLRVDGPRWQGVFDAVAKIDAPLDVLFARRGVIRRCDATPRRSAGTTVLEIDPSADARQRALLDGWLRDVAGK